MIEVTLNKGYIAIVDDCDADLAGMHWNAYIGKGDCVYAANSPLGLMHRVILSRMLGRELVRSDNTDHIKGHVFPDRPYALNNLRENLRLATARQNQQNKRLSPTRGGLKGAAWHKRYNKWIAQIKVDGRNVFLGYYMTAIEAHNAYCAAAIHYHGEFANDGTRPLRLADAPVATRQLSLFDELGAAS
jgi:hypothetical protein